MPGITSYKWDIDGDGLFGLDDTPEEPEGPTPTLSADFFGDANPNTSRTIGLKVCDASNTCSAVDTAVVHFGAVGAPTARFSPNKAFCGTDDSFLLELEVNHTAGSRIDVTFYVGNTELGRRQATIGEGENSVVVSQIVSASNVQEGEQRFHAVVSALGAGTAEIDSEVMFMVDNTPPVVTFYDEPEPGTCYESQRGLMPSFEVVDALDPQVQVSTEFAASGCEETLTVVATDQCGNETRASRSYFVAPNYGVTFEGPEEGSTVVSANVSWTIEGDQFCLAGSQVSYSRNGQDLGEYVQNQALTAAGDYVVTVTLNNCLSQETEFSRSFTVTGQ